MNTSTFHNLLQNPNALSAINLQDLKTIVDEFPYAQSARALYLKKLKQDDSFKYNHNLKVTAAYTTDRSVLFDFITSEEFNQNSISETIKQNTQHLENILVNSENISEKDKEDQTNFESHLNDNIDVLDPELFEEKQIISEDKPLTKDAENILVTEATKSEFLENQLNIGKPLEFTKSETHSFSEWLNLTKFQPIQRNEDTSNSKTKTIAIKTIVSESVKKDSTLKSTIAKKNKLIEAFISKNHKLEPKKDVDKKVNLAKAQMIPHEELMTETLARIYLEQKNYKKAIQSYKILSLKYPEKSGFFADQIKAVKYLQEQNNLS